MQATRFSRVVEMAARNTSIPADVMQSMASFVFRESKREMLEYNNLCIYIEGMINFYYGKRRLQDMRTRMQNYLKDDRETDWIRKSKLAKLSREEQQDLLDKINQRLEQYEVFIQERKECTINKRAFREAERAKNDNTGLVI